ncbi:MAG TPA: polyketide synthase dehydratase domain-containing protein, partial [Nevskiaceae bacterium]|nr:polyketide synthase dehydratase domain-containing protein [Nevskiaceae bacterium]
AQGGIDATVNRCTSNAWLGRDGGWLFDPGLLDVAPQLAIVWARINQNKTALPARFGRVRRFAGGTAGALQLSLRVRAETTDSSLSYDAIYRDSRGRVVLMLEDIEGTMSGALNRLAGQQTT